MNTLYCSFCGKAEHEVFYLVEAPARQGICDECVVLASDIIQTQRAKVARGEPVRRHYRTLAEFRASPAGRGDA
jgi:ATP-dependent protease Clp ATPase subunit